MLTGEILRPMALVVLGALVFRSALAAPDGALDEAGLVTDAMALMRSHYVDPAKIPEVEARLAASVKSGRYTGVAEDVLVERLNEDLLAASGDKHVYMRHDPDTFAVMIRDEDGADDGPGAAYFAELARTSNHGLVHLEVLSGNVRYLEIRPFFWDAEQSPAAYDTAMTFLAGGDALIIDLRRNGGGSMEAVNYLASHFLEPGTDLMTFDMGPEGVQHSRVTETPPAGRLDGRPLFVLVGERTGSAAEEAAMHFRHFELATLIGTVTAGAGNRNRIFPLRDGFLLSLSTGRAIHAVTGAGWEGTGVVPHVETPAEAALPTAHRAALEALQKRHPDRAERYREALSALDDVSDGA